MSNSRSAREVLKLKEEYANTWRDNAEFKWSFGLLEEVLELMLSLRDEKRP